jgi:hemoglobin
MKSTLFDDLGGETVLRSIIDRFVDRVFDDVMIGFFFRNASRERVKQKEYEFAAVHLGAPVTYTGRPLDAAHAAHPIMGGQFARRKMILKEVLDAHQAPEHVKQHWLDHTESLRPLVTADGTRECDPERARAGVATAAARKAP